MNNAGVAYLGMEEDDYKVLCQQAQTIMATNYWGTRRVCELLGPVLREGARVVMVSSSISCLDYLVTPCNLGLTCGEKVL